MGEAGADRKSRLLPLARQILLQVAVRDIGQLTDLPRLPGELAAHPVPLVRPSPGGAPGQAVARAVVTARVVKAMVKVPPDASMAAPMAASNSRWSAGGIWLWPPKVGTCSSHSSRV